MVTRSIVGRFLILAVLLVSLGVIAQAAIIISQGASKRVAKRDASSAAALASLSGSAAAATPASSVAAAAQDPAISPTPVAAAPSATSGFAPSADAAPVRVVYPGPLGDAPIQPRKITASLSSPAPLAAPSSAQPATTPPVASVPASPALAASAPAATQAAADPAPAASPAPAAAPAPTAASDDAKPAAAVVASADADSQPVPAAATGHGLNLNNASVAELNAMGAGHIGQAIVQHRPYHSVDDLVKKRVVRRSIFEQIKNQVAAE